MSLPSVTPARARVGGNGWDLIVRGHADSVAARVAVALADPGPPFLTLPAGDDGKDCFVIAGEVAYVVALPAVLSDPAAEEAG